MSKQSALSHRKMSPSNLKKIAMVSAARNAQIRGDEARRHNALKSLTISPQSFMKLSFEKLVNTINEALGKAISASLAAKEKAKNDQEKNADERFEKLAEKLQKAYRNLGYHFGKSKKSVKKSKKSVKKSKKSVRKPRTRK